MRGSLAEVSDPDDLERLRTLPLHPWAPGAKACYLCVPPTSVTGRRIAIPPALHLVGLRFGTGRRLPGDGS